MIFKKFIRITAFFGTSMFFLPLVSFGQTADGTADFEGLLSRPDTNWHGQTDGLSYFNSGSFRFANTYTAEWDAWTGCAYANIANNEYIESLGYGNQYKNVVGGGAGNSASYGILYDTEQIQYTGDTAKGIVLNGMYMTNSVMLYHTAMNGDAFAGEPFKTGDFFKALIAGISPAGDTSRMEFYLADYRDTDTAEHYILDTWEWLDLSGLGAVKSLLISFQGSRVGQYGQNLPLYAAMDDLNGKCPAVEKDMEMFADVDSTLLFSEIFGLEGKGKWNVRIEDSVDEKVVKMTVEDGALRIKALRPGNVKVRVKALRNGRSAYVDLSVQVRQGAVLTEQRQMLIARLYPVPAKDVLQVETARENCRAEIFSLQGRKMAEHGIAGTRLTLPLQGWVPGMYIIKITSGREVSIARFVVVR